MANGFGVFTAGRVGERATEERRFRQNIGLQERGFGLQERGLDIREAGQEQQIELQGRQETRLQGAQDIETEEGRRALGLERVGMIASLEASKRLLKESGQEDPGIGRFLESQGGVEQSLKFAKLNQDQFELMVLREMDAQRTAQREASRTPVAEGGRVFEEGPEGPVEIISAAEKPVKPPKGLFNEDGTISSTTARLINDGVIQIYESDRDPITGRLVLLGGDQGQEAVAVQQQASELLVNGSADNVIDAVAMAAQKFGISIPPTDEMKATILRDAAAQFRIQEKAADQDAANQIRSKIMERLAKFYGLTKEDLAPFLSSE